MILVDTSIWVDHLRSRHEIMVDLLERDLVCTHPFIIGELALGNFRLRAAVLDALPSLPHAIVADDAEVLSTIGQFQLFGRGIGYVDAHLLASARLTPETFVWTRDRRFAALADQLGLAARLTH